MTDDLQNKDDKLTISMASGVSSKTLDGFVHYSWGDQKCQFTPDEARKHALGLLSIAEAAEKDSITTKFFVHEVGIPVEKAASMLQAMRNYRTKEPINAEQ